MKEIILIRDSNMGLPNAPAHYASYILEPVRVEGVISHYKLVKNRHGQYNINIKAEDLTDFFRDPATFQKVEEIRFLVKGESKKNDVPF